MELELKDVKRILKNRTKKGDLMMNKYYEEQLEPNFTFKARYKGYGLDGDVVTISVLNLDELERIRKHPPMFMSNARGYVYRYISIREILDYANSIGL